MFVGTDRLIERSNNRQSKEEKKKEISSKKASRKRNERNKSVRLTSNWIQQSSTFVDKFIHIDEWQYHKRTTRQTFDRCCSTRVSSPRLMFRLLSKQVTFTKQTIVLPFNDINTFSSSTVNWPFRSTTLSNLTIRKNKWVNGIEATTWWPRSHARSEISQLEKEPRPRQLF